MKQYNSKKPIKQRIQVLAIANTKVYIKILKCIQEKIRIYTRKREHVVLHVTKEL